MKKLLIFTILSLFVMGSVAYATNTRVNTMGYANNIVKDVANIWLFPSTINEYPSLLTMDIDDNGIALMGAHYKFGEDTDKPWYLGGYFTDRIYWPDILPGAYIPEDVNGVDMQNQRIALVYGRTLGGGTLPFGVILDYVHSSQIHNIPADPGPPPVAEDKMERSFSSFDATLGLSNGPWDLAVGFDLMTFTIKDDQARDMHKPSGNMSLYAAARRWMGQSVPHATIAYMKQGREDYDVGTGTMILKTEITTMVIDGGWGFNYSPATDILAIADIGIQFQSEKTKLTTPTTTGEVKVTDLVIPYFRIGLDAEVLSWLDVRAGTYSTWNREKYDFGSGDYKYNHPMTDLLLGAGFHWGNFEIDAEIDPNFLTRGPNFISGENGDLSWNVSTIYWID